MSHAERIAEQLRGARDDDAIPQHVLGYANAALALEHNLDAGTR